MLDRIYSKLQTFPFKILFAAGVVFIILEFVILGKYSLFIVGDNISVLPYYLAFFSNDVPFANWTPFAATGTDMVATGYATVIYQWAFALLPPWLAFQVLVVAPILAGIFGVYGLGRRVFNLDQAASAFAGCAYGALFFRELFFLSSVPGYLPLTLLALHYLLDNKKNFNAWLGVIISGFLIAQSSFITRLVPWPVATYIVWFLIVEKRRKPLDWIIIASFSLGIVAARWQDIVGLLAYAPLSGLSEARGGGTFAIEMHKALQTAQGNLLGKWGVIAILLAAFAASFMEKTRRPMTTTMAIRLLAAMSALIGLLFLGGLVKVAAVSVFAFLSGFNTTYVMQGFGLMAVIAGGLGWQYLSDRAGGSKTLRWLPVLLVLMLLAVNLNSKFQYVKAWVSWGNFYQNTQNPALLALAKDIGSQASPFRALSFQMHGNLLNSYGIETIAGYHPLASRRYLAFWQKMVEPWHRSPGWQENHGRAEVGALTSLLPSTQAGQGKQRIDLRGQWRLADFVNMNLLSMMNGGYVVSRDVLTDDQLALVSGPGHSWSDLSQKDKILTNLAANFTGKRPMFIYKNKEAFARAYTVDEVRIFSSDDELLSALGKVDLPTLAHTVFVETSSVQPDIQLSKPEVLSVRAQGDKLSVEIAVSNLPTVLVISNSFSPYWACRVDGDDSRVFPANYSFWGLFMPAGTKMATCDYRPPYLLP